jgi:RHS repeat-associated protein
MQIFTYDGLSRLLSEFDDNGDDTANRVTVTRRYDTLSRPISETQQVGSGAGQTVTVEAQTLQGTSEGYDRDGNRTRLVYPSGLVLNFAPDQLGRVKTVSGSGPDVYASYVYSGPSLVKSRTFGNGIVLTLDPGGVWGYDGAKRIRRLSYSGAASLDLEYGYDQDSLRRFERRLDEGADGQGRYPGQKYTYTFSNDTRSAHRLELFQDGRLTPGSNPALASNLSRQQEQDYDAEGNWQSLKIGTSGHAVDDDKNWTSQMVASGDGTGMNQYSQIRAQSWSYAFTGALTSDGRRTYRYDGLDRLIELGIDGHLAARYVYDAAGRRVRTVLYNAQTGAQAGVRGYLYDGWRMIEEGDGAAADQRYIWANGGERLIAVERRVGSVWTRYYAHNDALGSVRALTTSASPPTLAGEFRYGAFGEQLLAQGAGSGCDTAACLMPYRYTGQRLMAESVLDADPETALYDYKNRIYIPQAGRFLTRDPAGYVDGANLYAYVRNASPTFSDPTGLISGIAAQAFAWDLQEDRAAAAYHNGSIGGFTAAYSMKDAMKASGPGPIVEIRRPSGGGGAAASGAEAVKITAGAAGGDSGRAFAAGPAIASQSGSAAAGEVDRTCEELGPEVCLLLQGKANYVLVKAEPLPDEDPESSVLGSMRRGRYPGWDGTPCGDEHWGNRMLWEFEWETAKGFASGEVIRYAGMGAWGLLGRIWRYAGRGSTLAREAEALASSAEAGVATKGVTRAAKVGAKIERQMASRGWTTEQIQEAIRSGEQIPAVNRATGSPAIRYVHPETGQSVVVDTVTNEVIHVGGPGFRYGPHGGEMP